MAIKKIKKLHGMHDCYRGKSTSKTATEVHLNKIAQLEKALNKAIKIILCPPPEDDDECFLLKIGVHTSCPNISCNECMKKYLTEARNEKV